MKKKSKKQEEAILGGVNIVPVIDVSLILLIILMVTNPFLSTPNLDVSLPKAHTLEANERNITITLTKDGALAVNTEIVSRDQLGAVLAQKVSRDKGALVIIRADEGLPYGAVQEIMDLAGRQAGVKNVALGTEKKE